MCLLSIYLKIEWATTKSSSLTEVHPAISPSIRFLHILLLLLKALITVGCGDACPKIAAKQRLEWQIPDPKNMSRCDFRAVMNLITF